MTTANLDVSVVLLALGVGVLLPVLVQAFLTLRTASRVMTSLDRRLEATLGDLSRIAGRLEPAAEQSQVASLIGAAVVPAIAAAVRSLRHREPTGSAEGAPASGAADAVR
jgi:hypothetical protein